MGERKQPRHHPLPSSACLHGETTDLLRKLHLIATSNRPQWGQVNYQLGSLLHASPFLSPRFGSIVSSCPQLVAIS